MDILDSRQRRGWNAPRERSPLALPKVEADDSPRLQGLSSRSSSEAKDDDNLPTDLLIQGLVERLPKPDSIWSLDSRAKWLRTAASIFGLVYKAGDSGRGEISVVLEELSVPTPEAKNAGCENKSNQAGEFGVPAGARLPGKETS